VPYDPLDIAVNDPVRHVISFTGFSGTINTSPELKSFYQFVFNPSSRRVSFITEKTTNYRSLNDPRFVYSRDTNIQTFNDLFLNLNPQIDFKIIKTYDMIADPEDNKIFSDFNKAISQKTNYLIAGLVAVGMLYVFLNKK
jgi:hypothetical protein